MKRDGRVVAEQPTTTNSFVITVLQQWRCYSTLEDTRANQKRLNVAYGNGVVFDNVSEKFTGNFDESLFVANQGGSIKIIASGIKMKNEKNCDYFRASIASLRGVNVFGNQGSFIFLSKVNTVG